MYLIIQVLLGGILASCIVELCSLEDDINHKLLDSCRNGETKMVATLVRREAVDINIQDDIDGSTPLLLTIRYGNNEMAKLLIKLGACLEKSSQLGRTPLLEAAHANEHKIVKIILNAGGDFTAKDQRGKTALDVALYYGYTTIAQSLSSVKNDFDVFRENPLVISSLPEGLQESFISLLYKHECYWINIMQCYKKLYKANKNNTLRIVLKKSKLVRSSIQKNRKKLRAKNIPLSPEEFEFSKKLLSRQKKNNFGDLHFEF